MKIIVDSGATKADWRIIKKNGQTIAYQTIGLNPFFVDTSKIHSVSVSAFPQDLDYHSVEKIYFYGAGCSSNDRKAIVLSGLNTFFLNSEITVESDIYGTAKALFGLNSGIAAILGTGSNSCLWDGNKIIKNSPSLGYILGDEGSGVHLGLSLLKSFFNNELPIDLKEAFKQKFALDRNTVLENIYLKPHPNRYLAQFAIFLKEQITHPVVKYILTTCFLDFFKKHIAIYPSFTEHKLRCVGSIAFHFEEILKECALNYEIDMDKIVQHPIDELVKMTCHE